MKTKSILAGIVVAGALIFTSCQKEPMACFTPSKTTAAVNESISFNSSCTMDGHHYEWEFGDGSMSTEENPTHAYANAGTYTVKCMAMSKNGKKMNEISQVITVQ